MINNFEKMVSDLKLSQSWNEKLYNRTFCWQNTQKEWNKTENNMLPLRVSIESILIFRGCFMSTGSRKSKIFIEKHFFLCYKGFGSKCGGTFTLEIKKFRILHCPQQIFIYFFVLKWHLYIKRRKCNATLSSYQLKIGWHIF